MSQESEIVQDYPVKNDKRERKQNAQMLPPGITQNMMKKYVVYYREMMKLKTGKEQQREYFKVESHPKLEKPWVSSKSVKISVMEKLEQANQVVADLENMNNEGANNEGANNNGDNNDVANNQNTLCKKWAKYIPKYTMLRFIRETSNEIFISLVFDKKDTINGIRRTGTYTFSCPNPIIDNETETSIIYLALQHLGNKLRAKYGADLLHQ
jgi:hypothetical protein